MNRSTRHEVCPTCGGPAVATCLTCGKPYRNCNHQVNHQWRALDNPRPSPLKARKLTDLHRAALAMVKFSFSRIEPQENGYQAALAEFCRLKRGLQSAVNDELNDNG